MYVDEETLELDEPEKEVYIKSPENTADDNLVVLVGRNGMLIDNFESLVVQTGDHVTYIDISVPDVKIHVQIVYGADNLEAGIINENRPLAQTLLDMAEGDEVELSIPGRPLHKLKIVQITRQSGALNRP